MDDGGSAADLPQRPAAGELADDAGLGFGEPEVGDGGVELVGGLAEDDLGGRVGEEPGGDLGGGGAVVGLGDEVRGPVGDAEVGDAVGAAELEAGLEVAGGVAVAEQRPCLVEDLDPLRAGAGHELLEPAGGGDHDERQRVGVERHGGEVEDEAGSVPAQRHGGGPVEHAAQRPGRGACRARRRPALVSPARSAAVRRSRAAISSVGSATRWATSARVGSASWADAGELLDGGEHDGVLELGEGPFEDGGDERGAHLGAAQDLLVLGLVRGGRAGGERVDAGGAAGAEAARW